jgi:hypothetical protein
MSLWLETHMGSCLDRRKIWYALCTCPILVVCGLLPGENNLTSGCHGDRKTATFYSPVCSPKGEAGISKNAMSQGKISM